MQYYISNTDRLRYKGYYSPGDKVIKYALSKILDGNILQQRWYGEITRAQPN